MSTERIVRTARVSERMHRRVYELLSDGGWHQRERVLQDVAGLIPPGIALRRYQAHRAHSDARAAKKPPPTRKGTPRPRTEKQQMESGRRAIVDDVLQAQCYEHKGDGEERVMRMVRKPRVVISDERRAPHLRPALEGLAVTFTTSDMPESAVQVRITAHEYGIHLSACPPDCSLLAPVG